MATDNGGLIEFESDVSSGDGLGSLNIGNAKMEFDSSVDSSHRVTFKGTAGTLQLDDPEEFDAKIAGFSAEDVIDLNDVTIVKYSYSGSATSGTLSLKESDGTYIKLRFSGDYTLASFSVKKDVDSTEIFFNPPGSPGDVHQTAFTAALFNAALGQSGTDASPTYSQGQNTPDLLAGTTEHHHHHHGKLG